MHSFCAPLVSTYVKGDFVENAWKAIVPPEEQANGCFYDLFTDGAGCYACTHQLLYRIDLSRHTGVYIRNHFIPESAFNKTALDGKFATARTTAELMPLLGTHKDYERAQGGDEITLKCV